MYSNTSLAIDLSPGGVTANDAGDADVGPNNLQNYPVLTSAVAGAGGTSVAGTLDSLPPARFQIDFYANTMNTTENDATGFGEGAHPLGSIEVTTDAAGRIYVGSLAFRVFGGETPKPGHLHVIDIDGRMRTLSDGVLLTNGLGFSPDGKKLYHCDARGPYVRVYDVNADSVKALEADGATGASSL